MRNKKSFLGALLLVAVMLPFVASAQEGSLNAYSPYTLYGLGNLNYTGSTIFSAMGGASIGYRSEFDLKVNTTNPASLSGLPRKTFFFDVGLTGSNVYLKQYASHHNSDILQLRQSSYNTFNISNITIAFPIAKRLAMSLNVAPYSAVGYRIQRDETDPAVLANLGSVSYYYTGEGDINEAKASLGWEPFKGLSIGAEFIYLWGNIDRKYQTYIRPYTGSGSYNNETNSFTGTTNEQVGRVFGGFGLQFTPINKEKTMLTLGATYRLGGKLGSEVTDYIPSGNVYSDIVRLDTLPSVNYIPQSIGVGVFFQRPKFAIGADYIYEDWARNNSFDADNNVGYVNTNTFKLGMQFTPNRYDVRRFFNRLTYRVGFRYNDYYLQVKGQRMNEKAVTFGVEVPFKMMSVSSLNVGVELGERGTLRSDLIRERFFKINVGVMLFGRDYDYWFEKYKYN
ncbi:MAG: hypothetical protein LBM63_04645 [Rikenellaceae bacterium]|jgi:hypothetical protein|nr:hypothetical protein [Rikenellaceae bacterium]